MTATEPGPREVRICEECGGVAEVTDTTCPSCGAPLPEEPQEGREPA